MKVIVGFPWFHLLNLGVCPCFLVQSDQIHKIKLLWCRVILLAFRFMDSLDIDVDVWACNWSVSGWVVLVRLGRLKLLMDYCPHH